MVFQHFNLFETLSVFENLIIDSDEQRESLREKINLIMKKYNFSIDLDIPVLNLSAGQKQKVEIIRCLIRSPKVLIMDEPTSVLTEQETSELFLSLKKFFKYQNKKINNNQSKIFTGIISGTLNGLTTLGGMPVALFLLITSIQPAVIRGSLAALFFLTDIYAFILSYFGGIVDMTTIYRTLPLIVVLPAGAFIGNKFFIKSKEKPVSYTHLRAHETPEHLVCRLLLEKKKTNTY